MADVDDETLQRVKRWCADAGRQAGVAEIGAALAPLAWDELLHVRALLADPPPARPLGPAALANLARGTPPDVAAEREREGRYRSEGELAEVAAEEAAASATPRPTPRPRRGGARRPAPPVVHRKRDAVPAAPPPIPVLPALEALHLPAGRSVLEQLIRKHGARRSFLLSALAGWRTAEGASPGDAELSALLDHHGLARAFAHRERDELLHALRVARGERSAAARALGLSGDAYQGALERLGAAADAERIRDERRAELRARATLADRLRMLTQELERLSDLGLLPEVEADLRARLPEHLRALRAGAAPGELAGAFARSVALSEPEARALAARLGLDLGAEARARRSPRPPQRDRRPPPRRAGGRRPAAREPGPRPRRRPAKS